MTSDKRTSTTSHYHQLLPSAWRWATIIGPKRHHGDGWPVAWQESRGHLWPKSLRCYNSRHLDFAPPSESELSRVRHLDVRLTRDLTWSSYSSCHVWKLPRHLGVQGNRVCSSREEGPAQDPESCRGDCQPPTPIPPLTYTCRQMQKKRGLRHHDPPTLHTGGFPPSIEAGGGEATDSEPASIHRQLDCWPLMVSANTNTHPCTSTFVRT